MITNDVKRTLRIQSRISMERAAFNLKNKKTLHQQLCLKFKEETSHVLHQEHSFA